MLRLVSLVLLLCVLLTHPGVQTTTAGAESGTADESMTCSLSASSTECEQQSIQTTLATAAQPSPVSRHVQYLLPRLNPSLSPIRRTAPGVVVSVMFSQYRLLTYRPRYLITSRDSRKD